MPFFFLALIQVSRLLSISLIWNSQLRDFKKGLSNVVLNHILLHASPALVKFTFFSPVVIIVLFSALFHSVIFVSRSEIISLRSERDRLALDAKFARERLDSFMKEFEHQVNFYNLLSIISYLYWCPYICYMSWCRCIFKCFIDIFVISYDMWQRNEINGIVARNVEFSQLIVDYQRKLRESSETLNASEELSRKLTMEVKVV